MVRKPRRVLIGWDYGARGIWWVLSREEREAPAPPGRWTGTPPPDRHDRPKPWSDQLSGGLLDDLHAWNDACAAAGAPPRRCKNAAAIRVQDELGTDDSEVLYQMGGRMLRVHPPGGWPVESWQQELLGCYRPRSPQP